MKQKIKYENLNAKQKESYNFQKISAVFADYGYVTIKLDDDWEGADFIAMRTYKGTSSFIKVQLKSRLTIDKKYMNKDLFIGFSSEDNSIWYLVPHDEILDFLKLKKPSVLESNSWQKGNYHFPRLDKVLLKELEQYKI
ncbi:MAG: hypothetical protein O3C63_03755 [Cyanobacteria bacterium]|nr:hypothetical protein [Cyanobacteriota bacterium]